MLIKVLGIGSPFAEDQAGWFVAKALTLQWLQEGQILDFLHIECSDRPGLRLIELMQGSTQVFLVDAVYSGQKVGTIHRLQADDIQVANPLFSTHHMGIVEALQLGKALDCLPEEVIFYGIEINSIEVDAEISDSVRRAIDQVVLRINNELLQLLTAFIF